MATLWSSATSGSCRSIKPRAKLGLGWLFPKSLLGLFVLGVIFFLIEKLLAPPDGSLGNLQANFVLTYPILSRAVSWMD